MHNISTLIEQLEELARSGHCITIERSTGEDWSVSISPTEFHPETEVPWYRWLAIDEWNGYGPTMQEAIADALAHIPR